VSIVSVSLSATARATSSQNSHSFPFRCENSAVSMPILGELVPKTETLCSMRGASSICWLMFLPDVTWGLSVQSSFFHGRALLPNSAASRTTSSLHPPTRSFLCMRKQKASDKRTRRRQRGDDIAVLVPSLDTMTSSPMEQTGDWNRKYVAPRTPRAPSVTGGRGRSRKRSTLYQSLSFYHNKFLSLLTAEYKAEVRVRSLSEVADRARFLRLNGRFLWQRICRSMTSKPEWLIAFLCSYGITIFGLTHSLLSS
jgi:hypothetical protein